MITKGVKELCAHAETIIETWSVEQAKEHYGDDDVVFVDIRDIRELWREGAIPGAMIGSDGIPDDQHPHPRLWGTFPRVLGHYARDLGLMSLEAAVHRMTGLPAAQFGFKDRGELRTGSFADLVIFNLKTVLDGATFETPTEPAIGIDRVFVNGLPVWHQGQASGERPGRPIRLGDTSRGG